jgi:hypothetical protein
MQPPSSLLSELHADAKALEFWGSDGRFYSLWPLDEVQARNDAYEVQTLAPGYTGFGSDGGGEMLAIAPNYAIVLLPFVGMEPSEAIPLAPNLAEFKVSVGLASLWRSNISLQRDRDR